MPYLIMADSKAHLLMSFHLSLILVFFAEGSLWLCNKHTVISFPWNSTGSHETDINVGESKPSSKLPHSMNVMEIF
jgi:hypothetical protein